MRFACLWDEWRKEEKYLATTALVTKKVQGFITDEFPIEFTADESSSWMEEQNLAAAEQMLGKKFYPEVYQYFKVTNRILDVNYNEQDLTVPVPEEINLFSFL